MLRSPDLGMGTMFKMDHCAGFSLSVRAALQKSLNTTIYCDNFVNIVSMKQKLHLSAMKTAILQLNDLYFRNCCTKNVDKLSVSVWASLYRKSKVRREVLN